MLSVIWLCDFFAIDLTAVSCQSLDDMQSKAIEAVLLLQEKINEDAEKAENITMRLLIPSRNIGCIIGKSGSIINEIRKRTRADIRISKGEKPKCADEGDEYVEVRVLYSFKILVLFFVAELISCYFLYHVRSLEK